MSKIPLAGCSPLPLLALLLPALAHAQAPPLTLTSPTPEFYGQFGWSVSGVPDADGDGSDDILVGTWLEDGGAPDVGRAYLFSGASGALLRTLTSPNPQSGVRFGFAVSGVPDTNGDGRGDLLVGAWSEGGGATDAGRAYLYSGATGALLRTLESPNPEFAGSFGYAVSGVRDADGDGRDDILVSAPTEAVGGLSGAGQAYLFSGASGALLRTLTSPNPQSSGLFGFAVSGTPDTNGDGRGDLLVGASGENVGGEVDAGRAHLFSGATGAFLRTFQSPSLEQGGEFGSSVAGVADADGDGRGDVLVGTWREDGGMSNAGRAYLFSGVSGAVLHTLQSPNPEFLGTFGYSVAAVPDVDGDGRGDLLVGAFAEDGGVSGAGRAYLFSGDTGALLRTLTSPDPEEGGGFGFSVAGVPDVNGDGRGDLLISAVTEDGGATNAGRAYLFPSGTGSGLTVTLTPEDPPVVVPEEGDSFRFTFAVENTGATPQTFEAWTEATFPDGTIRLALGPVAVALGAGESVTRALVQRVGAGLPAGAYTYTGYVGSYPGGAVASDGFPGVKLGAVLGQAAPRGEPTDLAEASAWATLYAGSGAPVAVGDVWVPEVLVSSPAFSPSSVAVSPNPFAGQTALRFSVAEASPVRLSVHDVLGREVAVLLDGEASAGSHAAVFDARGLASGVYVWRLASGGAVQTGRLTLLD